MSEFPSKLDLLHVWWDESARSAAENLAMDEALLDAADAPTLRFYQWRSPAVTMGYFQRWKDLPIDSFSGSEIARRWTGGGQVDHRDDQPYSLVVPVGHWLSAAPATESYRWIHEHLARALREATCLDAVATDVERIDSKAQPAIACFAAPVAWDVTAASSGRKISGAAQRRSRGRLLHQGSIIIAEHADGQDETGDWRAVFAGFISSAKPIAWSPTDATLDAAARLADEKYRTNEWRQRF